MNRYRNELQGSTYQDEIETRHEREYERLHPKAARLSLRPYMPRAPITSSDDKGNTDTDADAATETDTDAAV
tara:strand:- start:1167 stop:1382 length:216 start_codon:yes stop_codon:yes gene_type:complete